jgi:hypothetical protein
MLSLLSRRKGWEEHRRRRQGRPRQLELGDGYSSVSQEIHLIFTPALRRRFFTVSLHNLAVSHGYRAERTVAEQDFQRSEPAPFHAALFQEAECS